MKIALIHPTLDFSGGAEKLVMYLGRELQTLGEEVDIYSISFNNDRCYPELNRDLHIYSLMKDFPYANRRLFLPYEFFLKIYYCKKLIGLVNKNYDVVNCHNFPSTITAVKVKEKSKTPVVWFCHEPLDIVKSKNPLVSSIKSYDRKAVEKIDRIVTYSYNLNAIEDLYGRIPLVVYSGMDLERFARGTEEKIRKKHDIKGHMLLFVGQLVEHKRVQDLIHALKTVKNEIPDTTLIVVGDGKYRERLIKMTKELRLEKNVVFTGFVDEEELTDYYAEAELFLNPAIRQSWGLVPFEAMTAKTPVVISSDTGAAKVIQENDIGSVLDPLQPEIWAEKIVELLENEEERKKMADKGHKWVNENMSWEIFTKNMLNIFESVI